MAQLGEHHRPATVDRDRARIGDEGWVDRRRYQCRTPAGIEHDTEHRVLRDPRMFWGPMASKEVVRPSSEKDAIS
jgi:hypothetical protein